MRLVIMGIYSFYSKTLYIKKKLESINLFYTKFIPKKERSLTQLEIEGLFNKRYYFIEYVSIKTIKNHKNKRIIQKLGGFSKK